MMTTPRPSALAPSPITFAGILAFVAVVAVVFGYASIDGEFLGGDDEGLIRDHYFVNHPSWPHAIELLRMVHGDLYQPAPMLTFMANYALCGDSTRGYHAVNIGLHALCAMCAALLAWRFSRDPRAAAICGAMFACHPFAMESVAWITGRIILLAALFSLLLLLIFSLRRESPGAAWSISACVTWLLSLVSKVLPGAPIAAMWCDANLYGGRIAGSNANSDRAAADASDDPGSGPLDARPAALLPRRNGWWWATVVIILLETAALTAFAYHTTSRLDYFKMMQAESTTAWPARVMLASRYYFENYLWPTRLSAWSPPPRHVPLLSITAGIGALEWLALLGLFVLSRKHCRTAYVGIGLFMLLLAPFLAAMTARTFLTADRYMYLPIIGLHMALGGWSLKLLDFIAHRQGSRAVVGIAGAFTFAALLVAWAWTGREVAAAFHDDFAQARRAIALHPHDPRAWVELARTHVKRAEREAQRNNTDSAVRHADEAIALINKQRAAGHDDPELAAEAGEAHWHAGRPGQAVPELTRAVRELPRNQQARYYLGLALQAQGDIVRACALWKEIIAEKSKFLPAATALARAYRDSGDFEEAIKWFQVAIGLNNHHRGALFDLAELHMSRGDWAQAEPLLRRVLEINVGDMPAMLNLAVTRARLGDATEALSLYDSLLSLAPDNPAVQFNRAAVLAALRRVGEAEAAYRAILRARPNDRAAAIGLHELLAGAGRMDELVSMWRAAAAAPAPPDDSPGWLAFSLALAAKPEDALAEARLIAPADAGLLLAVWTTAWVELTRLPLDANLLAPAVESAATRPARDGRRREQLRAVVLALSDLSRQRPDDAACCYVMARALMQNGQSDLARRFLERASQLGEGTIFGSRARDLLNRVAASQPSPP